MIPREAYFARADETYGLGIPLTVHVPVALRASEASDVGQRRLERATGAGNVLEECSAREEELRP